MFVDNRLLNICVKDRFYFGLEIGLEAEAKTLEADAKTLEAEAGYFGLEAEARPRGLTSLQITNRSHKFSIFSNSLRKSVKQGREGKE